MISSRTFHSQLCYEVHPLLAQRLTNSSRSSTPFQASGDVKSTSGELETTPEPIAATVLSIDDSRLSAIYPSFTATSMIYVTVKSQSVPESSHKSTVNTSDSASLAMMTTVRPLGNGH